MSLLSPVVSELDMMEEDKTKVSRSGGQIENVQGRLTFVISQGANEKPVSW